MNDLIKVSYDSDRPTVLGRDLHEFLGVKTPYTQWFDRMKEYGFTEDIDFALVSQKCETNNPKNPYTVRTDHQLTIPMAKELCMLQRTEKGKEARQYFIQIEEQWNSPDAIMQRALLIANSRIEKLRGENKQLHAANAALTVDKQIMQPKALFADSVCASKSSILVGELAKILKQNGVNMGQNRLFEWLRSNGYLIRRKGTDYNMPTQRAMDLKLFEIKETVVNHADGHQTTSKTPKVTGKGQVYFINTFLKEAAP